MTRHPGLSERFFALLSSPRPGDALREAVDAGRLNALAHLEQADAIPAGPAPWHTGSVLSHIARCMNAVAGDPLAVWMALAHDAGKLTTPPDILPHHYGHEERGEALAGEWAEALGLPAPFAEAGCMTARLHMRAGRYPRLRPGKKYALLIEVFATPFADAFWKVVDADRRAPVSALAAAHWQKLCAARGRGASKEDELQLLAALMPRQERLAAG